MNGALSGETILSIVSFPAFRFLLFVFIFLDKLSYILSSNFFLFQKNGIIYREHLSLFIRFFINNNLDFRTKLLLSRNMLIFNLKSILFSFNNKIFLLVLRKNASIFPHF